MTESQAYIAFNLTENIGFARVSDLVEKYGSAVKAWEAYPAKVSRVGGEVDVDFELKRAKEMNVSIVTPADAEYPKLLKSAPGAPLALYVRGNIAALSKPMIAIIGTRRATDYGLAVANKIAFGLARAGWGVVSGLALGIDAAAHDGALSAKGITVGVIGSGLDQFYPPENIPLARAIIENDGAVISEFPFGRPPDQQTFPIRNHVVAALARGVLAVEAPLKSGTLITTGIAADLGRTVMAIPGRIDDRMSFGCLKLIRDGAILVRNVDEVLEAMSELLPNEVKREVSEAPDPEQPRYSAEEAMIMLHVDNGGVSIDELVQKTGLDVNKVNALAMELRLKGFVRFLPGNRIATKVNCL